MKFPTTLIILSMATEAISFVVQPSSPSHVHTKSIFSTINCNGSSCTTALFAKKKRRRRRKDAASSSTPTPKLNEEDELPDFDLIEDIDLPQQSSKDSKNTMSTSSISDNVGASFAPVTKKALDPNDPAVLEAMKATKGNDLVGSSASTRDLLRSRNRELEQKLVVDEIVQDVPSFADYNAKKRRASGGNNASDVVSGGASMGKKAMKREQRRAAALEAEDNKSEEEESAVSQLLSRLPFVNNNDEGEKEEKSPIKVSN